MNLNSELCEIVDVSFSDRWQVYRRLQELGIPCLCITGHPLKVEIKNVNAAVQLWSVIHQISASRRELAIWLDRCLINSSL